MIFFFFFCGGRGRGSIFSCLAVVGFFFPKALTTGIIPEPTVNQIHKLSLSEGELSEGTIYTPNESIVKQQDRLAASLAVWVSGYHWSKSQRGCWAEISLEAEYLVHTAMNIQCYRFHTDVYSSFSHNFQIVEATKMNRWINKLWYIQMMEYYSALKKTQQSVPEKTRGDFKCKLLWRKSIWKGYIL